MNPEIVLFTKKNTYVVQTLTYIFNPKQWLEKKAPMFENDV